MEFTLIFYCYSVMRTWSRIKTKRHTRLTWISKHWILPDSEQVIVEMFRKHFSSCLLSCFFAQLTLHSVIIPWTEWRCFFGQFMRRWSSVSSCYQKILDRWGRITRYVFGQSQFIEYWVSTKCFHIAERSMGVVTLKTITCLRFLLKTCNIGSVDCQFYLISFQDDKIMSGRRFWRENVQR